MLPGKPSVDVTLRVRPNGEDDGYTIQLTSPHVKRMEVLHSVGFSALPKLAAVRQRLEDVTQRGRLGAPLTPARGAQLLDDLREIGGAAYMTFLGGKANEGRQERVAEFFRDALEGSGARTPTLQLVSSVDLPIDFFTVLDDPHVEGFTAAPSSATYPGKELVAQASKSFLGYRFVIQRMGRHGVPIDHNLAGPNDRVAVRPYTHSSLRNTEKTIERFRLRGRFDVGDVMPDEALVRQPGAARRASLRLLQEGSYAGLLLIWAHCEAADLLDPLTHSLVFARSGGIRTHEVAVHISTLMAASQASSHDPNDMGPLAFISACAAANRTFTSPTDFPEIFMNSGYRGVIAPLVSVHVTPAHLMVELFVNALYEKRMNAGVALLDARTELLRQYCSPLGLLYTLYGDTSLRCFN